MAHDRLRRLVPALADGQLGPLRRRLLAWHVARCPACAAELEAVQRMRSVIRTRLPAHRAPPGLAVRIGAALPREAPPPAPARPWFSRPALGWTGGGMAGALAGVGLTLLLGGGGGGARDGGGLTTALIDDHIRSLEADHLTDVLTSDQHTVKPWLSGRVDVSPPVQDLAPEGFPLVGGRLDYVDGHRTAAVVYRRDKHVINLFAWAAPGPNEGFRLVTRQGFHVVSWRHAGISYSAVSDVEADQLERFAHLVAAGS
jgi:anti-sigma factor RsiW